MTIHRLSNLDGATRTADCAACGHISVKVRGTNSTGETTWRCLGRLVTQHTLVDIDEASRTAFCRGCQKTVKVNSNAARSKGWVCAVKARADSALNRSTNPEASRAVNKTWRDANRDRIRDYQLNRLYEITLEEYRAEVERRGGQCDVCGEVPNAKGTNGMSLCVEHSHVTGEIRGYTDRDCNVMIGSAHDDPVRLAYAIVYLKPTPEQAAEITRILYRYRTEAERSAL